MTGVFVRAKQILIPVRGQFLVSIIRSTYVRVYERFVYYNSFHYLTGAFYGF